MNVKSSAALTVRSLLGGLSRVACVVATLIGLASLSSSLNATIYTYTAPNSTTTNTWSSGTSWSAVPVSAADTTLVFAGSFNGASTATAQDNIAGAFQLNTMTLAASETTNSTVATYNVTTTGGTLNFINNGATTAVVNLTSNNGNGTGANINTAVSINASIDGGSLTFQGNGSGGSNVNGFTYSGILSDGLTAASVIKSGSSVLTLSGANTFTGGLTLNAGGLYINNAKAIGTGTLTVAGGTLNNTSGGTITLFTNIAQNWNGNFSWGGSNALNLGTGAVTLSGNRSVSLLSGNNTSAVNGSGILTVGGVVGDGGSNSSLSVGNPGKINTQTVALNNTANTYGGGTVVESGVLQAAAIGSLGTASGASVRVNYGATLGAGYAIDQATLQKLTANSTGTVALAGVNSSNNLDFSSAGVNLPVSLGATGTATYLGTLTPQGQNYRLGGGFGTLTMANALGDVNSVPTALVVGAGGSSGTVTLGAAGTYTGGTTVTGIPGSTASVLQTNVLTGASNTPFGPSTSAITLNNGTLGFGTAATLSAGNVMNVTGYNVTFDTGTIKPQVGSGSSVTYTANSLNQSSLGGVLYIAPTSAATLGNTEKVFVTNASATIPLTVTNGIVAPSITDSTNKTFLTYDAVKGYSDATTTTVYGANNVVSIGSDANTTISAYAFRIGAALGSSDNLTLGAGGFLSTASQNNATGTINFGSTPGYYGVYGAGTSGTAFNATSGVTFYGTGMGFSAININITGGITFASGSWSFTPQPTGNEQFQTTIPNALILLSGAAITESQGSKMTFASIQGGGAINESLSNAFTLTINGLNSTGTTTFNGAINGATGGTGNIVKTGTNTQVFAGLNSYNGTTTINGGTLKGTEASGTPFGLGSVTLGGGVLSLAPSGSGAAVALTGANLATGSTLTFNAGAQVTLDKGSNTSLAYTVGNTGATANSVLVRGTNGTMILTPASGTANLGTGTGEKLIVNGGVTTTNTIVSAAIIAQDSNTNKDGTFLAYDATNGLKAATYSDTNFAAAASASVEDVTSPTSVNTQTVYALRSSTALTLNTSQTLTVGNGSLPAGVILNGGSISGGTALAFGASPGVIYSSGANGSIGSAITGSGGVSIMGPGMTTLSSASSSYTGGTLINNSTLSISNNLNLGAAAGALTLNGGTLQSTATLSLGTRGVTLNIGPSTYGGVFDVASGTTLTAAGVLSGSGGLIKTNTGTLTLSGVNTFTGFTVVNGGTLNLSNASALASSTLTTGGTVFDSSVVAHAFTFGGLSGGSALSLMDNASNPVALSVGNNGVTTSYSGVLSGTGSLLKIGGGTLTLTGANTYAGKTSIQAGALTVSSLNSVSVGLASSNLGAPTTGANGTIAIGATTTGATLNYVGAGETSDRVIDLAGTTGGATLSATGTGALVFSSNLTATGVGVKTLALGGNSDPSINNTIQGAIVDSSSGATSVTKSGLGTWVLSGNSSYTGTTTVGTQGILKLGAAGSGGNGPLGTVAAGTTISSGGTLDLNGFTLANAEALTLNGNGVSNGVTTAGALINSSSTATTYSGLVTLGAASKIFAGNGDIILSNAGTITGATFGLTLDGTSTGSSIASIIGITTGGLTKQGTGSWTLSGASTYTGATTVSAGTLAINGGTLGSGGGTAITVASGASLTQNATGSIAGTSSLTSSGTTTLAGANTYSGLTTVSAGTLVLSGTNSSAGAITLNGGTLQLNNATNGGLATGVLSLTSGTLQSLLANQSLSNAITLTAATISGANNITFSGDLSQATANTLTSSITGGNTLTLAGNVNIDQVTGTARTLTIAGTGNTKITGVIRDFSGGVGTAHGSLTITNTGTTTLTGANTYAGTTTVSGGTLLLDMVNGGSLSSASSLSLGSGSNFTVSGAASGAPSAQTLVGITTTSLSSLSTKNVITLNGGVNISATTLTSGGATAGLTLVRGSRLGLDAVGTAGSTNVKFSTAPTLVNAAGTAGTSTVGVVANMMGDTSASGSGSGFLTYDATTGLRLLAAGETTGSLTANSNVKLTGSTTSSAVTVNSLELAGGSFTGTANTITIANNILLVSATSTSNTANFASFSGGDFYLVTNSDFTTTGNFGTQSTGQNIYKFGAGTATGNFSSSSTGGVVVEEGTFALSSAGSKIRGIIVNGGTFKYLASSMQIAGNGLTVASGTTADFNGTTGNGIVLAGAGTITNTSGTAGTLAVNSGTFTGNITSNLNLSSSGALTLSGANTYTGTTSITGGTLTASGGTAIGDTSAVTLANVAATILSLTSNETIGSLTGGGATGGNVTLGANTLTTGGDNTSPAAYAGVISGTGGLTKIGSGTQTLSGANTYTGTTSVSAGTVSFNSVATGTGAQSLGGGTTINLGSAGTSSGTLSYTGAAGTLDKAINALGNGSDTVQNSGSGLLTLSGPITKNGTTLNLNGGANGINVTGTIAGSSAHSDLVVNGGTVTLSAANTYVGPTFVNTGATLALGIANAIPSNSDITLGNATTTGTLDMKTFSTTANSLDFVNGSTIRFDLTGLGINNSTALLALAGNLTKDTSGSGVGYTVDFSGFSFTAAGSYKLVGFNSVGGSFLASDFAATGITGFGTDLSGTFQLNANDLSYVIASTAIPEPSTYAAIFGALALAAAALRRRRRN